MAETFRKEHKQISEEQKTLIHTFKDVCATLEALINAEMVKKGLSPKTRCYALAMTKLEECAMWFTKGVTTPSQKNNTAADQE